MLACQAVLKLLRQRLRPFRRAGFRSFFFTQLISVTGSFAHELARSWLVLEIMGNATALSALLLATSLPSMVLSLYGGALADRVNVRRLLIATKIAFAIVALATAATVELTNIQLWMILIFAALEGAIIAFDIPAYQAVAVRLVPRFEYQRAITLMSSCFHLSRAFGPMVAGAVLAFAGPSMVFFLDGISFIALIFVLRAIKLRPLPRAKSAQKARGLKAIGEGLNYCLKTPHLRYVFLQFMLTITLIFPLMVVVLRTYMKVKFDLSGDEFGFLFSMPAFGSALGAFYFIAAQLKNPLVNLWVGIPGMIVSMVLLTYAPTINAAGTILVVIGLCGFLNFQSLTHTVHLTVQEEFRGRAVGILTLGFMSIGPLMGFPIGVITDNYGFEFTLRLFSALFAAGSLTLLIFQRLTVKESIYETRRNLEGHPQAPTVNEIRRH